MFPFVIYGQKKQNANCSSGNIELSYKCFVGKTLTDFIRQINLDTSKIRIVEEPPAVIKGVRTTIGDSCMVRVYINGPLLKDSVGKKRFAQRSDLEMILNKRILGITWVVFKGDNILRRGSAGDIIWYWND